VEVRVPVAVVVPMVPRVPVAVPVPMVVRLAVGVAVARTVGVGVAVPGAGAGQQADADGGQEQAAAQAEPGIDTLGGDRPGGAEDQAEDEDPAVWATVTVAPMVTACPSVPRRPTR